MRFFDKFLLSTALSHIQRGCTEIIGQNVVQIAVLLDYWCANLSEKEKIVILEYLHRFFKHHLQINSISIFIKI